MYVSCPTFAPSHSVVLHHSPSHPLQITILSLDPVSVLLMAAQFVHPQEPHAPGVLTTSNFAREPLRRRAVLAGVAEHVRLAGVGFWAGGVGAGYARCGSVRDGGRSRRGGGGREDGLRRWDVGAGGGRLCCGEWGEIGVRMIIGKAESI